LGKNARARNGAEEGRVGGVEPEKEEANEVAVRTFDVLALQHRRTKAWTA
jgi:hypothetical protein